MVRKYRKYKNYPKRSYKKRTRKKDTSSFLAGSLVFIIVALSLLGVSNIFKWILVLGIFAGVGYGLWYTLSRKKKTQHINFTPHLAHMRAMDPFDFEHYVAEIFKKYGFRAKPTVSVGDHGIDIWMYKDGVDYAVQVKRYQEKNTVGEKEVRDFYGSFVDYRNTVGWFVTTSDFTKQAYTWAQQRKRLRLIPGEELSKIIAGLLKH